jgi:hypothetical protein
MLPSTWAIRNDYKDLSSRRPRREKLIDDIVNKAISA